MLVSYLLQTCKDVEKFWKDDKIRKALMLQLQAYLNVLQDHPKKELTVLSRLADKITPDLSYKQFLSIVVPIERQYRRGVVDSDIIITTQDQLEGPRNTVEAYFILDNIRSAFNVGSIFRSAECFGIKKIFLCGYTSTPNDAKTLKSTMGTESFIEWEWIDHVEDLIEDLQIKNINIYALETSPHAITLSDFTPKFPCAFILGNEKFGLDENLLSKAKNVICIPLQGRKNSLNVGVTAGIVAHHISRFPS